MRQFVKLNVSRFLDGGDYEDGDDGMSTVIEIDDPEGFAKDVVLYGSGFLMVNRDSNVAKRIPVQDVMINLPNTDDNELSGELSGDSPTDSEKST